MLARRFLGFVLLCWITLVVPWCGLKWRYSGSYYGSPSTPKRIFLCSIVFVILAIPVFGRKKLAARWIGRSHVVAVLVLPALLLVGLLVTDAANTRSVGTITSAHLWLDSSCYLPTDDVPARDVPSHWFDDAHKTLWYPDDPTGRNWVVDSAKTRGCLPNSYPNTETLDLTFVSANKATFTLPNGTKGSFHREDLGSRLLRYLKVTKYQVPLHLI